MLEAAHYALLFFVLLIIGLGFNQAAINAKYIDARRKKLLIGYTVFVLFWSGYTALLSVIGVFKDFSFPPRIPLLLIVPIFSFFVYFFSAKRFKPIIEHYPIQLTVYFQSFRIIVELLILGIFLQGYVPEIATFEGRNFDILAGITAPIIGWLAFSRKVLSYKALLIWNIACLVLLANIVFIFISLLIKPEIWGYTVTPVEKDFVTIPFMYIASVYMPAAVFMHVFNIKKILALNKKGASV